MQSETSADCSMGWNCGWSKGDYDWSWDSGKGNGWNASWGWQDGWSSKGKGKGKGRGKGKSWYNSNAYDAAQAAVTAMMWYIDGWSDESWEKWTEPKDFAGKLGKQIQDGVTDSLGTFVRTGAGVMWKALTCMMAGKQITFAANTDGPGPAPFKIVQASPSSSSTQIATKKQVQELLAAAGIDPAQLNKPGSSSSTTDSASASTAHIEEVDDGQADLELTLARLKKERDRKRKQAEIGKVKKQLAIEAADPGSDDDDEPPTPAKKTKAKKASKDDDDAKVSLKDQKAFLEWTGIKKHGNTPKCVKEMDLEQWLDVCSKMNAEFIAVSWATNLSKGKCKKHSNRRVGIDEPWKAWQDEE